VRACNQGWWVEGGCLSHLACLLSRVLRLHLQCRSCPLLGQYQHHQHLQEREDGTHVQMIRNTMYYSGMSQQEEQCHVSQQQQRNASVQPYMGRAWSATITPGLPKTTPVTGAPHTCCGPAHVLEPSRVLVGCLGLCSSHVSLQALGFKTPLHSVAVKGRIMPYEALSALTGRADAAAFTYPGHIYTPGMPVVGAVAAVPVAVLPGVGMGIAPAAAPPGAAPAPPALRNHTQLCMRCCCWTHGAAPCADFM
jgi:hypothetical protein